MTSEHLSGATIEAYLDGELPPEARSEVEAHIGVCARCRQAVHDLRIVSHTVSDTAPKAYMFCAGRVFWQRLSARLTLPREGLTPYGALALLPPILLGALGLALTATAWLIHVVGALAWFGAIPPLGPAFYQWADAQAANPETPFALRWMLDTSLLGIGELEGITATWPATLRTVLHVGIIHLMLAFGLAITIALFVAWAWCLPDAFASEGGTQP